MASYQQDLPPKNGFEKVEWAARGSRKIMKGYTQLGLFVAVTAVGWTCYYIHKAKRRRLDLEMSDARVAIQPFLLAEKDRAILKHYRRNREEENELMKDVPGWTTGTLWGEPVFYNVRERYLKPSLSELLIHMDDALQKDFVNHKNMLGVRHGT